MIQSFENQETADIFNGISTKSARKLCPFDLWKIAFRKLDQLNSAVSLEELRSPPGNRLELLKGELSGKYSIRINSQYRICFVWNETGPSDVGIVDYH